MAKGAGGGGEWHGHICILLQVRVTIRGLSTTERPGVAAKAPVRGHGNKPDTNGMKFHPNAMMRDRSSCINPFFFS